MSALSDRIAAANKDNLSTRDISSRAEEFGIHVAHGTLANVLNGTHGTPQDKTLRALSKVFQIPFSELRRLCGLSPTEEPWTPPVVAARLSLKQRKLVESLIHELVRPEPPQS